MAPQTRATSRSSKGEGVRMSDLRIGGVPIGKLKVAELKAELEARGLSKTGNKGLLVAKLTSFMEVCFSSCC